MKPLMFIIGTIVILLLFLSVLSYIKNTSEDKEAAIASTRIEESVFKDMVSSEEKMQEAQKLLSKKEATSEDQANASRLIEEAISDAKKAADAQPDNPRTWFYLSEAYQKLMSVNAETAELAEDALNKAIALAPQNAIFYGRRANIYIFQKNYPEAEKDLRKALQLDPRFANHYYKLGNVYKGMGKKEQARQAYLQAKKLTPATSKMNMAQIEAQLKQLEK